VSETQRDGVGDSTTGRSRKIWYGRAWSLARPYLRSRCAAARYGKPQIFNTDQGSQFTSLAFTEQIKAHGIAISMDGRGCWTDNVFVERLWRSVKYEEVYLRAYGSSV